jgi:hypothetical protein
MPDPRDSNNEWQAGGSHIITADDDYKRKISNGGPGSIYFGVEGDNEDGEKIGVGQFKVIDKTGFVYGHGAWVNVQTTDEDAGKVQGTERKEDEGGPQGEGADSTDSSDSKSSTSRSSSSTSKSSSKS